MTIDEAREKYGTKEEHFGKRIGYVYCQLCPLDKERGKQCRLLRRQINSLKATGYDDCWEIIAKYMTEQETKSTERESENTEQETESVVDHPSHYAGEKYECIEVMREVFGEEATKNFCLLNAFKYIWRCGKKHESPDEDINKAIWYLNKYLATKEENE